MSQVRASLMITRIDRNPLFNGDFFPKAVEK